jgi:hypothetical protein
MSGWWWRAVFSGAIPYSREQQANGSAAVLYTVGTRVPDSRSSVPKVHAKHSRVLASVPAASDSIRHWSLGRRRWAYISVFCRSQWPRRLRRGSTAAYSLGLRVRIPPMAWLSVSCECHVVRYRSLRGLITRPEESYEAWCVRVYRGLGPLGASRSERKICM